MILFEGFNQKYTVEELSIKQAERLLAQQALQEIKINKKIEQIFSRSHSYRSQLDVKVNCK